MSDHTMKSTPTVTRSQEGVRETRRCTACGGLFSRRAGSGDTHREVDETVECPVDAEVTTVERANRWTRR